MTLWRTIGEILAHWTDTVATGVIAVASRFFSPRLVRLVEDDKPDMFALEGAGKADPQRVSFANGQFSGADLADAVKGSRIELVLRPSRFLVRPLELPARANEFIEGIVRVQIDRCRSGVRLRHAGHRRLRQDRDHDRGDDAGQYRTLH
jgi:general secretion pathway protein L